MTVAKFKKYPACNSSEIHCPFKKEMQSKPLWNSYQTCFKMWDAQYFILSRDRLPWLWMSEFFLSMPLGSTDFIHPYILAFAKI